MRLFFYFYITALDYGGLTVDSPNNKRYDGGRTVLVKAFYGATPGLKDLWEVKIWIKKYL